MSEVIIRTNIPKITAAMRQKIREVVHDTTNAAMNNIEMETKQPHHGRSYPSRRDPGAMHQASAPGESWATDTESLIASMKPREVSELTFEIQLNDYRWAVLEFGGGKILPRPTVQPMFANMQDQFTKDVFEAAIEASEESALYSCQSSRNSQPSSLPTPVALNAACGACRWG